MKLCNRWIGWVLLGAAAPATAIEFNPKPAVEEIYVSGTRSASTLPPVATNLTVLDRQQIELSGAQQLTDLLRSQPGIQLRDADGSGGRNVVLSMGGFGSNATNNTLVLVDGRRLNNPSLAGPALNSIPLGDIERVEIIQGSAGVLYGDQAVGGVINIVTRRARPGRALGYMEAHWGSLGQKGYGSGVMQSFDSGWDYGLSLQHRQADNYRENNQRRFTGLNGHLGYRFASSRLYLDIQRSDDKLELPGALNDEQLAEDRRQASTPEDFSDLDTRVWRLGWDWQLSEHWQFLVEYSEREERADGVISGEFEQITEVENLTPRLVGSFGAPGGRATTTLGLDRQDADFRRSSEWGDTLATQELDAWYGQVIYPLTAKLTASGGLRRESVTDSHPEEDWRRSHRVSAQEWGLSYRFSPAWRLYGRLAEGFRFANVDEYSFTDEGVEYLEPQESRSLELGVEWQGEKHRLKTAWLQMDLDNEIVFDPAVGFGANVNLPASERDILLLELDYRFNPHWRLRLNHSYTDAQVLEGSAAGYQVPFVARHAANGVLLYTPMPEWSFYLDASYTGPRYRIDDDFNEQPRLSGRVLVNANIGWRDDRWELGLRVDNLTGETYSDYQAWSAFSGNYEYPKSGRTVVGRLTYRY